MSGGFWDQRYEKEGKIWGESPSPTAAHALQRFREAGITEILVPGCGYGRNALVFAQAGMRVTGLESSAKALAIARQSSTEIRWVHASVLDANLGLGAFEGIYAMNLLHLFLAPERKRLIANCRGWLIPGGIACFTVFGDSDSSRGRGREVEADTFESRPGRPAHYFDEDDLRAHFTDFDIVETGRSDEPENHPPAGPHVHSLRYAVVRKPVLEAADGDT